MNEKNTSQSAEMYHGKRFDIPMDVYEALLEFNRKVKEELSAKAKEEDAA